MKTLSTTGLLLLAFACAASPAETRRPIRVALFDDTGSSGKGIPRVMEQIAGRPGMEVSRLKGAEFQPNALRGYDVVLFTGGSGSKQAATIGEAGREEVRRFVRDGGGYVGICAGAYLACAGFSWGVGVLDAKTVSSKWKRGRGTVRIELLAPVAAMTGLKPGSYDIRYANGPIITPLGREDIPDLEPLAVFRTELAKNGSPAGVMTGSPAMARGRYGKGRVFISSPHPEQTAGMEKTVENVVRWAAGREQPRSP